MEKQKRPIERAVRRPAIPAPVARLVVTEAGHRCAVCGDPCPLERAHIVPWAESQSHAPENLLCLCANCHQRADQEHWGEKILRWYKENPWVERKNTLKIEDIELRDVIITCNLQLATFDSSKKRLLRYALASFLEIPPEKVTIEEIIEGSVKVTVRLPAKAAEKLSDAAAANDVNLENALELFNVKSVEAKVIASSDIVECHVVHEEISRRIAHLLPTVTLQSIKKLEQVFNSLPLGINRHVTTCPLCRDKTRRSLAILRAKIDSFTTFWDPLGIDLEREIAKHFTVRRRFERKEKEGKETKPTQWTRLEAIGEHVARIWHRPDPNKRGTTRTSNTWRLESRWRKTER